MKESESSMEAKVKRCIDDLTKLNPIRRRVFWEVSMVHRGIIPPRIHTECNDVFGVLNEHHIWEEWNIPSIDIMRRYWKALGISDMCAQQLLSHLPGKTMCCAVCQWQLPETAMHQPDECVLCHESTAQHLAQPLNVRRYRTQELWLQSILAQSAPSHQRLLKT